MKKIGLYFGSFNPVTNGHMLVAHEASLHVDEVWFVLSPKNPQKDQDGLLDENERRRLLFNALDKSGFVMCDIEFHLPKPSYTDKTLDTLEEKHPDYEFFIITGTDAYNNVVTWVKGDEIMEKYPFIVVSRGDEEITNPNAPAIVIDGHNTISATLVRDKIKNGQPFGHLVPPEVEEIIISNGLYQ